MTQKYLFASLLGTCDFGVIIIRFRAAANGNCTLNLGLTCSRAVSSVPIAAACWKLALFVLETCSVTPLPLDPAPNGEG